MPFRERPGAREDYHHGNLREALIQAALALIAEKGLAGFAVAELARAVGVSPAAPYRHFRDRNAVLAEVARRGFDQLASLLGTARTPPSRNTPSRNASLPRQSLALERCAQAHLAFAAAEAPVYATMFRASLPAADHPEVARARSEAFAVLRAAAQDALDLGAAPSRPPARMVALHVWSMTHGIADLFLSHDGDSRTLAPIEPRDLLEAGLLIYLRSLQRAG